MKYRSFVFLFTLLASSGLQAKSLCARVAEMQEDKYLHSIQNKVQFLSAEVLSEYDFSNPNRKIHEDFNERNMTEMDYPNFVERVNENPDILKNTNNPIYDLNTREKAELLRHLKRRNKVYNSALLLLNDAKSKCPELITDENSEITPLYDEKSKQLYEVNKSRYMLRPGTTIEVNYIFNIKIYKQK